MSAYSTVLVVFIAGLVLLDFYLRACSHSATFPFAAIDKGKAQDWFLINLKRAVLVLVPLYLLVCMALWYFQDSLIYIAANVHVDMQEIDRLGNVANLAELKDPDGNYIGFVSKSSLTAPKPARGTVIVTHGNGTIAPYRADYVEALEPRGFRVILYEYPGFGGRPGRPNSEQIVEEMRALVRRVDAAGNGPVYLWGESLGSGVAGQTAADPTLPVQGIVLITPFNSLMSIAWNQYPFVPVPLLIRDKWDSVTNLAHYNHPVFMMTSQFDELVPKWSSDRLYDSLTCPKKLLMQPDCGHNDWPTTPDLPWWTEAADFVAPKGVPVAAAK